MRRDVGSERDLEDVVLAALATELKVDVETIKSVGSLKTDLKMDSISAVNVAFMLEEELGIEIDLKEDDVFESVEAIVRIVARSL